MLKQILRTFFILILFLGCTRDDICSEETLTTPLLVIEFRDINNRLESKAVEDLRILVNNTDSTEVAAAINDTIVSIPLNTEADFSSFLFIKNGASDEIMDQDVVTFTYSREEIYLNRACAFKVVYHELLLDIENETANGNWMLDSEILNPNVTDETEAHITIFH